MNRRIIKGGALQYFTAADQTARLAMTTTGTMGLVLDYGDVVKQLNTGAKWRFMGGNPSVTTNWESADGIVNVEKFFNAIGVLRKGINLARNTNLTIKHDAGSFLKFSPISNVVEEFSFTATNPLVFDVITQTGTVVDTAVSVLPVTKYDNAGISTTIATNSMATAIRVYMHTDGRIIVMNGQAVYINVTTAVRDWANEVIITPPALVGFSILGIIITRGDTTNLSVTGNTFIILSSKLCEVTQQGGAASYAEPVTPVAITWVANKEYLANSLATHTDGKVYKANSDMDNTVATFVIGISANQWTLNGAPFDTYKDATTLKNYKFVVDNGVAYLEEL